MRTMTMTMTAALLAMLLGACQMPGGTATTPVGTTTAQNVGQDQATSQATESGSANAGVNQYNIFGARNVTIDAGGALQVETAPDAELEVAGAAIFGSVRVDGQEAEVSSGGGAAGGTGGTTRQANEASPSNTVGAPPTGGGGQ